MRARRLSLPAVLGTLVLSPVLTAFAAQGQLGIRLLDAPVGREDDPRARLYIVDHVAPGTTITRHVEVSSELGSRARLSLYAAGAEVRAGTFRFFDARTQNDVSSWTRVEPSEVSLKPGAATRAVVTIKVPEDASGGERYAVVWAETSLDSAAGLATTNRVGIRIYLSVGGGAEPSSDFVVDTLTASRTAEGRPQVSAMVRNTGQRALDMSGTLDLLDGPGGLQAGPFRVELGTTLGVGESSPVVALLDKAIPPGPWGVRLVLRSGRLARTAIGRITFPIAPGTSAAPVRAVMATRWGRALVGTTAMLIVTIGGFLILYMRRRSV